MPFLILILATVSAALALGSAAYASCAAPSSVAENGARAIVVVHGTVTRSSEGAVTLRVVSVLKGEADSEIRAFLGPERGGRGGTAVATSVDYTAPVGSEHVLYLIRGQDGQLETNACIGSHPGAPDAAEISYFGAGASPIGGSPADPPATDALNAVLALGAAFAALLLGVIFVLVRQGARRMG
jgi:hypothetical protein